MIKLHFKKSMITPQRTLYDSDIIISGQEQKQNKTELEKHTKSFMSTV